MNTQERHIYETLRRVRDFGVAHSSDFPADSLGSTLFASIGATVAGIETLASSQGSGISTSRQLTETKALARKALISELEAIGLIGRALALETPGVDNKFRLSRKPADSDLLTLARSFLADCTPLSAEFVRNGMPADFPGDLKEAITAFEQSLTERDRSRVTHVSATASINPALEVGMKQLKQLSGIVRTIYRQNPAMLAAWSSMRHIQRSSTRSVTHPPPPPAVAAEPAAESTVKA